MIGDLEMLVRENFTQFSFVWILSGEVDNGPIGQ